VDEEDADLVLEVLDSFDEGVESSIIGRITDKTSGYCGSEYGNRREKDCLTFREGTQLSEDIAWMPGMGYWIPTLLEIWFFKAWQKEDNLVRVLREINGLKLGNFQGHSILGGRILMGFGFFILSRENTLGHSEGWFLWDLGKGSFLTVWKGWPFPGAWLVLRNRVLNFGVSTLQGGTFFFSFVPFGNLAGDFRSSESFWGKVGVWTEGPGRNFWVFSGENPFRRGGKTDLLGEISQGLLAVCPI